MGILEKDSSQIFQSIVAIETICPRRVLPQLWVPSQIRHSLAQRSSSEAVASSAPQTACDLWASGDLGAQCHLGSGWLSLVFQQTRSPETWPGFLRWMRGQDLAVPISLMIPYVTRENDRRTNIGLNSYSTRSMMKGDNPEADVVIVLYGRNGNVVGNGSSVVHSNQMLQIRDVISALGGGTGTGWLMIFSDEAHIFHD